MHLQVTIVLVAASMVATAIEPADTTAGTSSTNPIFLCSLRFRAPFAPLQGRCMQSMVILRSLIGSGEAAAGETVRLAMELDQRLRMTPIAWHHYSY